MDFLLRILLFTRKKAPVAEPPKGGTRVESRTIAGDCHDAVEQTPDERSRAGRPL